MLLEAFLHRRSYMLHWAIIDCEIVIQTRGYEDWQGGEANLLITRGMVGRLSNTPNVGFAYEIQGVTEFLTSRGVKIV